MLVHTVDNIFIIIFRCIVGCLRNLCCLGQQS